MNAEADHPAHDPTLVPPITHALHVGFAGRQTMIEFTSCTKRFEFNVLSTVRLRVEVGFPARMNRHDR